MNGFKLADHGEGDEEDLQLEKANFRETDMEPSGNVRPVLIIPKSLIAGTFEETFIDVQL